ncbi:hypothetical protein Cgig2_029915 [Carnegiea gigantea]|uniref:BHLH domain-containing protein n=1 Tax=Carnegiea gigantea TaxID=171969 RepID=A0A9Q1KIE4_9CARY|nr:hypothetical protein Cgig2_029915 [Carnegiea gigantea]
MPLSPLLTFLTANDKLPTFSIWSTPHAIRLVKQRESIREMSSKFNSSKPSSSKDDRKTIEKNRRSRLKQLYSQLYSLVPNPASSSGEPKRLPDQIEEAINYIKNLQEDVGKLKQKKDSLLGIDTSKANSRKRLLLNSPVQIEVNENGGGLEVTLVTSLECQFVFTEVIRILHEESAEVFDASYSVVGGPVFHTIHAQIGEAAANNAVARIAERLKKFTL